MSTARDGGSGVAHPLTGSSYEGGAMLLTPMAAAAAVERVEQNDPAKKSRSARSSAESGASMRQTTCPPSMARTRRTSSLRWAGRSLAPLPPAALPIVVAVARAATPLASVAVASSDTSGG